MVGTRPPDKPAKRPRALVWSGFQQHINGNGESKGPAKETRLVKCMRRFGETEAAVWKAFAEDCTRGFSAIDAWPSQFEQEMAALYNPDFACKGPSRVKVMQEKVRRDPSRPLYFLSGQGYHSSGILWVKKYVDEEVQAGRAHSMSDAGFLKFLEGPKGCPGSAKSQLRCFEWMSRGAASVHISVVKLASAEAGAVAGGECGTESASDEEADASTEGMDAVRRKKLRGCIRRLKREQAEEERRALLDAEAKAKADRALVLAAAVRSLRAAKTTVQRTGSDAVDVDLEKRSTSSRALEEIGSRGDVLEYWAAVEGKKELHVRVGDAERKVDVSAVVDQGDSLHVYFCESKPNCCSSSVHSALGQLCLARDIIMEGESGEPQGVDHLTAVLDPVKEVVYHFVAAFSGSLGSMHSEAFRKRGFEVWCYLGEEEER